MEEKDNLVKITQVMPACATHGIMGLGDDNKLYEWSYMQGKWLHYKKGRY